MTEPGLFTDSTGIVANYTPIEDVEVGGRICSGWRPFPEVHGVERSEIFGYRMWFGPMFGVGSHVGGWRPAGTLVPVLVHDPCEA